MPSDGDASLAHAKEWGGRRVSLGACAGIATVPHVSWEHPQGSGGLGTVGWGVQRQQQGCGSPVLSWQECEPPFSRLPIPDISPEMDGAK